MTFEDRQAWAEINEGDYSDEELQAMQTIPPGEEAMFLSHEGGEDELCHILFEEPAL